MCGTLGCNTNVLLIECMQYISSTSYVPLDAHARHITHVLKVVPRHVHVTCMRGTTLSILMRTRDVPCVVHLNVTCAALALCH